MAFSTSGHTAAWMRLYSGMISALRLMIRPILCMAMRLPIQLTDLFFMAKIAKNGRRDNA
jgi:hypothetical protein